MLLLLSHVLAFSTLFVASISDLKTTEVPDSISVIGVIGGLLLHIGASLQQGVNVHSLLNLSLMLSEPLTWLQALGDPLMWSLGIGAVFSIYGWGMYFLGMWGGADAFAMSILGFAAPYGLSGPGVMHSLNMFLNMMIAGFIYTLVFAFYKAVKNPSVWDKTLENIRKDEKKLSVFIVFAALFSSLGLRGGFSPYLYFGMFVSLVLLYEFLHTIQEEVLKEEVEVSELEGGEVLGGENAGLVKGVDDEKISDLDAGKVVVREGILFVPVFPIALLITDVFGGGAYWMMALISV